MRTLEQILEEMQKLPTSLEHGDPEATHQIADDLLIEALRLLAERLWPHKEARVEALISAYNQIEKWYA